MKKAIFLAAILAFCAVVRAQQKAIANNNLTDNRATGAQLVGGLKTVFEPQASELAARLNAQGVRKALTEANEAAAIKLFRQAAAECFVCPTIRYNLARSLTKVGETDEALKIFDQILSARPDYAAAHAGKGDALHNKGLYREAVAAYRESLKFEPNDAAVHCNLGNSLHHVKLYAEALESLDQAVKLDPALTAAYSNRGVTLFTIGEYKKAAEDLRRAVALDPLAAEPHNNLAVALTRLGKKKEAHKHYLEAVRLRPDWNIALYNLAISHLERGERDRVRTHLAALERIDVELGAQLKKQFWQDYVLDAAATKPEKAFHD